ncbi:class I adenylate-forming enzyme family protein [Paramicrobacterium agarici]|uniref:class I adenylate-forming enzyme family protein n=1 Tax=Paramicrobacterium agarici TaxID=630514 RepID=UPI0011536860|nr:class I adenylate-forming enzyme family protein [Microbacterium agarici]TQO24060.1 acyl-CoA synthetase (AMP-forming)/AMP-acid ligase II [Microbacterium agarici]
MPFTRTILEVAETDPARLALAGDGERYTYDELRTACTLVRSGAERLLGTSHDTTRTDETRGVPIIAVSLTRSLDVARFLCGANGFRAIIAVLDPLWPESHRVETIRRVDAALVITDDAAFENALLANDAWSGTALSLERFDELAASAPVSAGPEVRPRDEPFLLLFTSGTTDLPKGFVRTRESWDHNVAISRAYLGAEDGYATIAPGPVSYSLTLYALVEVMATGGSLYLQSGFDAIAAARTIDAEQIERFVGVPSMLLALVRAAEHAGLSLTSLREVITGGANQNENIRTAFETAAPDAHLRSYYGASEIGFIGYSDSGDGTRLIPFDGVEVSVRDGGTPLPEGEIGTLYIRVASAVERYLASTSSQRITGADGWSSVDDQASFANGMIELAGRAGDIAVSGGHKVSLPQVERALATVPGCETCCAVALPDPSLGSIIAVAIESDELPAKATMQAELKRMLAPQFVPHRYYRVDELPRTAGGKIRRTAVTELIADGGGERL